VVVGAGGFGVTGMVVVPGVGARLGDVGAVCGGTTVEGAVGVVVAPPIA